MENTIKYHGVKQLNETGYVTAVYTTKNDTAWKYGKEGAFENCVRLSSALGIKTDDMVMVSQKHTDKIKVVTRANGGEMVTRFVPDNDFDGMITDERGLMLCTLEADCVPVYLLDPLKKVIGMVHSGWRGTAKNIAVKAVSLMNENFGSDPCDIIIVTGPCICAGCYEVGKELKEDFSTTYSDREMSSFFIDTNKKDKYLLDLKTAIRISLERTGVLSGNILDVGKCTRESSDLCSWRRDNPVVNSMLTGIILH
ncbi:MAG: peptidoglycan editing factor PgeF [Lachnospiraceae bacterium]|nr:peptidoglycan editing factor PgeF [Lachnospiraceae bacterium]